MLFDSIKADINLSLKKGDKVRVDTLRFLDSACRYAAIAKYGADWESKVTDTDVLDAVKKQVKTHRESIKAFTEGGRTDLANSEKAQLTILESFLPPEISDDDLKKILAPIVQLSEDNFGKLMGRAMSAVGNRADGGRVSAILKDLLAHK